MVDDAQSTSVGEPIPGQADPGVPDTGSAEAAVAPDHPHTGVAEEGWSAPAASDGAACTFARLVVKRGGAETDIEFPLAPPAIIGRFDPAVGPIDVDLGSLPEGTYVSRKHACVACENGVWTIEDMGSSNGTFVLRDNFERVTQTEIHDGDEIALGNARFVFRLQHGTD
jgi:hypothetical protein